MEDSEQLKQLQQQLLQQDLMHFDISSLIAGFVFGVVGWWMFKQGRKKENKKVIGISVALMAYPYFIEGAIKNWGLGFLLCFIAYYFWDKK